MALRKINFIFSVLFILASSQVSAQVFSKAYEAPNGLWQTTSAWADFDNDQDYDFIVAGWDPAGVCNTWLFENQNQNFVLVPTNLKGLQRGSLDVGDINNDGLMDIVISGKDDNYENHTIVYINEGGLNFTDNHQISGVFDSSVKLGDFNNDGRADIGLTGENGEGIFIAQIFENRDNDFTPIESNFPGTRLGTVDWADFNNDGYLDFTLTGEDMNFNFPSNLYENLGNGEFQLVETPFVGLMYTGNDWGDYDDDGDLDLAISGETMNAMFLTHIFINDNSKFSLKSGTYNNTMNGTVKWGDFNNDGKLDLITTGVNGSNKFSATIYENRESLQMIESGLPGVAIRSTGIWADYDADLDLDLLLTGSRAGDLKGIIHVYENQSAEVNAAPLAPSNLSAETSAGNFILKWEKGTDSETENLSYNVYLKDLNTGKYVISPESHENGFRKIQKIGNAGLCTFKIVSNLSEGEYEWAVQSIDNSLVGSSFSGPVTLSVGRVLSTSNPETIFEIYPNPVSNRLNFTTNLQRGTYQLVDLTGKLLINGTLVNESINTSELPAGAYILRIKSESFTKELRIIKN